MIASGGRDYNILLWDIRSREENSISKGPNVLWDDLANDDARKFYGARMVKILSLTQMES
jgi:hypothetical protein